MDRRSHSAGIQRSIDDRLAAPRDRPRHRCGCRSPVERASRQTPRERTRNPDTGGVGTSHRRRPCHGSRASASRPDTRPTSVQPRSRYTRVFLRLRWPRRFLQRGSVPPSTGGAIGMTPPGVFHDASFGSSSHAPRLPCARLARAWLGMRTMVNAVSGTSMVVIARTRSCGPFIIQCADPDFTQRKPRWLVPVLTSPLPRVPTMYREQY